MSSPGPTAPDRIEIAAHADAALRTVRIVLAVLSILLLGAYRPLTGPPSWMSLVATLTAIIAAVAALNAISRHAPAGGPWAGVLQALDVLAVVAMAVVLDDALGHRSWVLLVVPVVSAAVRSGAVSSVLAWVGGCAGYVAAAYVDAIDAPADIALVTQIPGSLLAIAITIGLLARWMREGWEIQNDITAAVATREHRLSVLEETRHALTRIEPESAVALCTNQALALGYDAVTVHHLGEGPPPHVIGRSDIVAATDASHRDVGEGPVVTIWTDEEEVRSHSVAVHEPLTNTIITGWAEAPIDRDHANMLATLVAITSNAIETTTLLRRLRYAADHDPLTGLLNRRALDRKLSEIAANPGRLSIAFIDLDDFKHINDTHGHDIGDKALVALARRLEAVVGTHGLLSRFGGDEFVVLLPNIGFGHAQSFARAALRMTSGPIALGPAQLRLRLSIGVVTAATPIAPSDMLHAADNALYQAKSAGKATFVAIDVDAPEPAESTDPRSLHATRR